jgi:DNA-binding beta-propeller fold protein YncE
VRRSAIIGVLLLYASLIWSQPEASGPIQLPSGQTLEANPGRIAPLNSSPFSIALSPDGHYAALLHAGFGTQKSGGCQSISIFNLSTNQLDDFPDDRLCGDAHQSYFVGITFSADSNHIYASIGSITDPTGEKKGNLGNAIAVYQVHEGKIVPERIIKIPPTKLAEGKWVAKGLFQTPQGTAIPYPAGLAVVPGNAERLLIANNFSDTAVLIDASPGDLINGTADPIHQFDLSTNTFIPSAYPYTVVVSKDGRRGWCSLWNASRVVELNLEKGTVARTIPLKDPDSPTAAGSHPTALLLSPDEKRLYVALSNADLVAVVSTETGKIEAWLSTKPAEEKLGGTTPIALTQTSDGKNLFVADASLDAVAVFDTSKHPGEREWTPDGFLPAEWYPSALAVQGNQLLVASAKGTGTGPNNGPNRITGRRRREHPYIPTLVYGSLAEINIADAMKNLSASTNRVAEASHTKASSRTVFADGKNPIKHVIYIIKENRTYDQVFGDLKVGNGDPSLTMYGQDITPNQHKLALQFGVLDNFYDSGEVSGDGHVWSTAAITSDYNEKTWPITYRGRERTYDFEGMVADEYPLERGIPDVDSPQTGYLWANASAHHLTYRDYGEFISTEFCVEPREPGQAAPKERPSPSETAPSGACEHKVVKYGEPLSQGVNAEAKTAASPYPWDIPNMKRSVATMRELRGHSDLQFASFNVDYPDQLRADEFLREFDGFVKARREGKGDELANFVIMHLPNDHTGGTRPGKSAPAASVADNDLALGRIADAVSHSPYWDDTAIFVLEDDAQDGVDHVDAHRSLALIISKYAPGSSEHPFVDHDFHTTVSMIRTMEHLLGLPAMNINDAHAPSMANEFSRDGNQPAFTVDTRNKENGLIYKANPAAAAGAKQSSRMDFSHPDAADAHLLNAILWHDRKGDKPLPASKHTVIPASPRDGDD